MTIPTPYAGSYYPLYNFGENQYIPPSLAMPFKNISALFFAFAHAYPTGYDGNGNVTQASLALEASQPLEPARIAEVMTAARLANPKILFFISLGWGKLDWTYINADYEANGSKCNFVQSVVALLRAYALDGFDIDDESINTPQGGYISQENFSAVIGLIKAELINAGVLDSKYYYFSITPAGGTAMITNDNIVNFDLVNTQNYGGCNYGDFSSFSNAKIGMFAYGVSCENDSRTSIPSKDQITGMAGVFNWSLSADSLDKPPYSYTNEIAQLVGYNQQQSA